MIFQCILNFDGELYLRYRFVLFDIIRINEDPAAPETIKYFENRLLCCFQSRKIRNISHYWYRMAVGVPRPPAPP